MATYINLQSITTAANAFTDETFRVSQVVHYFNEVVGNINAELDIELPFIDPSVEGYETTPYTALTETWVRAVIIPYICYAIKVNDSSIVEANNFLRNYEDGMRRLNNNKDSAIDPSFQNEGTDGVFSINYNKVSKSVGIPQPAYTIEIFDVTHQYFPGEQVFYAPTDKAYECIVRTIGNYPTNTRYWVEV